MANYRYSRYQYETSPRKLEPEYNPIEEEHHKKSTVKKKAEKAKPKRFQTNGKFGKKRWNKQTFRTGILSLVIKFNICSQKPMLVHTL